MLLSVLKILNQDKPDEESKQILIRNINGISVKAKSALERAGINSLYDLLVYTQKNKVTDIRGAGIKFSEEIKELLEKYKQGKLDYVIYDLSRPVIKDVFSENKFNRFVSYCNENGIVYVDELKNFDFETLKSVEGIGECKFKEIVNLYEKTGSEGEIKYFKDINDDVKQAHVSIFEYFGVHDFTIVRLEKHGYVTVGTLENINRKGLVEIVGRKDFDDLIKAGKELKKSLIELIKNEFDLSTNSDEPASKRETEIILKRCEGQTFEEIGNVFGISRQRIQMIESEWYKRTGYLIKPYIFKLASEKNYIEEKELEIYENDLYNKMLKYWCSKSYVYVSSERIFVKKENIKTK